LRVKSSSAYGSFMLRGVDHSINGRRRVVGNGGWRGDSGWVWQLLAVRVVWPLVELWVMLGMVAVVQVAGPAVTTCGSAAATAACSTAPAPPGGAAGATRRGGGGGGGSGATSVGSGRTQWRCVCAWNVKASRATQVWARLRRGGMPAELEGRIREIRMVRQWDQEVRFDIYVARGAGDMSTAIGRALKCRARWHRSYQEREFARRDAAEKLHKASGVKAKNDTTRSTEPPGAARSRDHGETPGRAAGSGCVHLHRMQVGPRRSERVIDTRAPGSYSLAQRLPVATDGHGRGALNGREMHPTTRQALRHPSSDRCGERAMQRGHKAGPRAPFRRSDARGVLHRDRAFSSAPVPEGESHTSRTARMMRQSRWRVGLG
jgi:hypothetical protein